MKNRYTLYTVIRVGNNKVVHDDDGGEAAVHKGSDAMHILISNMKFALRLEYSDEEYAAIEDEAESVIMELYAKLPKEETWVMVPLPLYPSYEEFREDLYGPDEDDDDEYPDDPRHIDREPYDPYRYE